MEEKDPMVTSYLQQGWQLSRFNHWLSPKEKKDFLTIIGEENIMVLNEDMQKDKWNAIMLISPVGVQILNLYHVTPAGNA